MLRGRALVILQSQTSVRYILIASSFASLGVGRRHSPAMPPLKRSQFPPPIRQLDAAKSSLQHLSDQERLITAKVLPPDDLSAALGPST